MRTRIEALHLEVVAEVFPELELSGLFTKSHFQQLERNERNAYSQI